MWDLSFLTSFLLALEALSLNHWTIREPLHFPSLNIRRGSPATTEFPLVIISLVVG